MSIFLKKFMVLSSSLIIGTSCFAMESQEGDASPSIPGSLLSLTVPTPFEIIPEVACTIGQALVPSEIWFTIFLGDTKNDYNLIIRNLSPLRGVSKNWYYNINSYFTCLSPFIKRNASRIEKYISDINIQLMNNKSGLKGSYGILADDKTSLTKPIESNWRTWDEGARNLFTEKLKLTDELIKNEYSLIVKMNIMSLNELILSNPTDRVEIETKGLELLAFIKSVRSKATTISMTLPEKAPERELYLSMGKSFARDIKKLEESTDVFGANAKKPSRFVVRKVAEDARDWASLINEAGYRLKKRAVEPVLPKREEEKSNEQKKLEARFNALHGIVNEEEDDDWN